MKEDEIKNIFHFYKIIQIKKKQLKEHGPNLKKKKLKDCFEILKG
jgi:hypothetical protein